jgi:glutathione S-transferase
MVCVGEVDLVEAETKIAMASPRNQVMKLVGAPMSPYSRKMRAYLRYKGFPFIWLTPSLRDWNKIPGLTPPKVLIIPILYLPQENYEIGNVDSTILMKKLELIGEGNSPSIIPSSPAISFVSDFIEDFADEWLTKAMMHYRWTYQEDITKASTLIAFGPDSTQSQIETTILAKQFAKRQISRLENVIGLKSTQSPLVERSFLKVIQLVDRVLEDTPFLFGHRPTSADFGLFGQFSQLVLFDPTPSKLVLAHHPRVTCWTQNFEDLSLLGSMSDTPPSTESLYQWPTQLTDLTQPQLELLRYLVRIYLPFLKANALALQSGHTTFTCQIDGHEWSQNVFPYQGKCFKTLVEAYQRLPESDQQFLGEVVGLEMK